jgi:acid phosphatase family membrane protein YuiD
MSKKILAAIFAILFIFMENISVQAHFGKDAGIYRNLLTDLKKNLHEKSYVTTVTLDGVARHMFISWIRDHIHTMKAYKY